MIVFLSGVFIGGSLTYAWLWWSCREAARELADAFREEIDRSS